ncbi:nucleotide-binding domain containing protein [Caproiciproducens sp.]
MCKKTTDQLEYLKNGNLPVEFIQYDQHRVLEKNGLQEETRKVAAEAERLVRAGRIVAIHTRRDRLDLDTDDSEKQLEVSTKISDAIVRVIAGLDVRPRFLIAKGGITSSDIATKALHIWRAKIMGQIEPGIPVWLAGPESKFPGMAYIIFPGNVGNEKSLFRIVSKLM